MEKLWCLPKSEFVLQKGDEKVYQYVLLRMLSQRTHVLLRGCREGPATSGRRWEGQFLEEAILEVSLVG